MSEANKTQVGGGHYRKNEYQCWDFIDDIDLRFIPGNAVKYVSRWRDKNGIEDLRKTVHYLQKTIERNITVDPIVLQCEQYQNKVIRYATQLGAYEAGVVTLICMGEFKSAITDINELIGLECRLNEIIKPTETKEGY